MGAVVRSFKYGVVYPIFWVGIPLLLTLLAVQNFVDYFHGAGWDYGLVGIVLASWAVWDFIQLPEVLRALRVLRSSESDG